MTTNKSHPPTTEDYMFTSLHALAKKATLMITIAAEGDDQLRVNVTPMPTDTKSKAQLPHPLSLLGAPAEFDAYFMAALGTWQAPKRTLVEQAQEAAGGAPVPAAGSSAASVPAPAEKQQDKPKAGRKARADKSAGADAESAGVQAADEATSAAAAAADQVMAGTPADDASVAPVDAAAPADAAPPVSVDEEAVDKFTLDLF